MTNGITWEEELLNRIAEAVSNRDLADESLKKAEIDSKYWLSYAESLLETLRLYREKQGVTTNGHHINAERMRKQSTWTNLLEITSTNNGVLVVIDATTTLVEAKVFGNREHARNVIYSTLNSHKRDVEWVRQGVYQLHKRTHPRKKTTNNKAQKPRAVSGVMNTIKRLKDRNPHMTQSQALTYLIDTKFDFKGKIPSNSVNMAWVRLGYNKENKQAKMPITTVGQVLRNMGIHGN